MVAVAVAAAAAAVVRHARGCCCGEVMLCEVGATLCTLCVPIKPIKLKRTHYSMFAHTYSTRVVVVVAVLRVNVNAHTKDNKTDTCVPRHARSVCVDAASARRVSNINTLDRSGPLLNDANFMFLRAASASHDIRACARMLCTTSISHTNEPPAQYGGALAYDIINWCTRERMRTWLGRTTRGSKMSARASSYFGHNRLYIHL